MNVVISRLWNEQEGAIVSAEILMIGTILVIGVIVGLKSVRDAVVSELADFAQAVSNANQSYSYSGVAGHATYSQGGCFHDQVDFCENNWNDRWQESKCVSVAVQALPEQGG